MSRNLSISETGLKLIKAFEGYRPVDRVLVTGARVVGYGHRLYSDRPVNMNREDADKVLREDLAPFEELVNEEVLAPLSQSQFDALCSLAFNIGPKAFRGSDIVRALNNGRPLDAANGFDVWRTSTINGQTYVVDALMRRRTAEKSLFLRTDNLPNAPTAMVPPQQDTTFPHIETGDGLPVYTDPDPHGHAETVPYTMDDVEAYAPPRPRAATPASGMTLSEVLDLEDDAPPAQDNASGEADIVEELDEEDGRAFDIDDMLSDQTVEIIEGDDDVDPMTDEDDLINNLAARLEAGRLNEADTLYVPDNAVDSLADNADDNFEVEADQSSAIAEAADKLRARLDNLIDQNAASKTIDDRSTDTKNQMAPRKNILDALQDINTGDVQPLNNVSKWPTSMINSDYDEPVAMTKKEPKRSNLVAFPGAARKTLEPDAPIADETFIANTLKTPAEETLRAQPQPQMRANVQVKTDQAPDITIDELVADDLLRGNKSPSPDVSQRDNIDIVSRQAGYEDGLMEDDDDSASGLWIPILLGFALLGASIAAGLRGSQALMGDWGPIAVVAGIITGTLMVVFSIYISLTQKS